MEAAGLSKTFVPHLSKHMPLHPSARYC